MNPIDDNLLFDRLVDDELSPDQREELLSSLDDQPDGWRRCALTFLEHQSWRRQMKALVADPTEERATPVQRSAPQNNSQRAWSLLAMAASLLVAFLAGRMIAPEVATPDAQQQLAVTESEESAPQALAPAQPRLHDRDVVTLLVRDDQGQAKRVRVPLVDLADDRQSGNIVSVLPEKVQERFKRQGKGLRLRRRFAPLYIEQNEQVVPVAVPVDDAYIVPVSRPVL